MVPYHRFLLALCCVLGAATLSNAAKTSLRGRETSSSSSGMVRNDPEQHDLYGEIMYWSNDQEGQEHASAVQQHATTTTTDQKHRFNVVGGVDVGEAEAPFFVAMMNRVGGVNSSMYSYRGCGGSLISPRHILTAAHCIAGRWEHLERGSDAVMVHAYKPFEDDGLNGGVKAHFSKALSYTIIPTYVDYKLTDDVGIITMETPIPLEDITAFFPPIHLADDVLPNGYTTTAYGLGRRHKRDRFQVDTVRKVDLGFIQGPSCVQYQGVQLNTTCQVCAGFWEGKYDICKGDSGGPLVADIDGVLTQVGIVSWGDGCGAVWKPSVYASVPYLKPWIVETICSDLSDEEMAATLICGSSNSGSTTTTSQPTLSPTPAPTDLPTNSPTGAATTASPTPLATTENPTVAATTAPPTLAPTSSPTPLATTENPTVTATTISPTPAPTSSPTPAPTNLPTQNPIAAVKSQTPAPVSVDNFETTCTPYMWYCDPDGAPCCEGECYGFKDIDGNVIMNFCYNV